MWQIYETWRFITVFWRARRFSISWARSIQQTTSHYIPVKSVLISTFRFSICSFSSGYPTKILYTFLLSSIYATCPTSPISLISSQILQLVRRKNYEALNYVFFFSLLSRPSVILTAVHWTYKRGPRPTANLKIDGRCVACRHANINWKSDAICQIK
jgi:hypothetical protein